MKSFKNINHFAILSLSLFYLSLLIDSLLGLVKLLTETFLRLRVVLRMSLMILNYVGFILSKIRLLISDLLIVVGCLLFGFSSIIYQNLTNM